VARRCHHWQDDGGSIVVVMPALQRHRRLIVFI